MSFVMPYKKVGNILNNALEAIVRCFCRYSRVLYHGGRQRNIETSTNQVKNNKCNYKPIKRLKQAINGRE